MPDHVAERIWQNALDSGSFNKIFDFIWTYLTYSGVQSTFFIMLWTLTLRVLLITFYFSLMYIIIAVVKKRLHMKLSAAANYNSWHLLLGSVVLANLPFSNGLMALPVGLLGSYSPLRPYILTLLTLILVVWFVVAFVKLAKLMRMNRRIKKSIRHMERYADNAGIAEWVMSALRLRRMPDVWIAGFIETPVSYGFFRKTVLLPANYNEKYTETELSLLILHEMTHIKHGDTAKLFLIQLIGCILWMSPAVGRFTKSFKRDSEVLCDNRVISLRSGERDTYGELILKECAYRTARFGFGFSDSYNAVANRLDALYRYKAMEHLKWMLAIPVAALMFCVLSFSLRTEWIAVNDRYNADFEFYALDKSTGDYVLLTPDGHNKIYEIEEMDGHQGFIFNDENLWALAKPYASDGQITIKVVSQNYVVQTSDNAITTGLNSDITISEKQQKQMMIGLTSYDPGLTSYVILEQRTLAEFLFLLIASKI